MGATTITLPEEMLAQLRALAQSSQRSLDEVVREAVDAYLTGLPHQRTSAPLTSTTGTRFGETTPAVHEPQSFPPDAARSRAVDAALARIRTRVPEDLTPEEIDAEIDAAWDEVREARRLESTRT